MIKFLLFLVLSLPLFAQDVRTERHNEAVDAFKNLATKNVSKRRLYDTSRIGHSNEGHYFESFKNLTAEKKAELIEYLKSL